MMLFLNVNILPKDIILLYEAGIDLALVTATGVLLHNRYSTSQNFFYSLAANDELTMKEEYYKITNGVIQVPPTSKPLVKEIPLDIENGSPSIPQHDDEFWKDEERKFKDEMSNYSPLGGSRFADYKNGDNFFTPLNDFKKQASDELARTRRHHIRNAMKHAW